MKKILIRGTQIAFSTQAIGVAKGGKGTGPPIEMSLMIIITTTKSTFLHFQFLFYHFRVERHNINFDDQGTRSPRFKFLSTNLNANPEEIQG